jgi:biotin operon repressor
MNDSHFKADDLTRNLTDGGWYWVPKTIITEYARGIGAIALAVYNVLASMVNRQQECFPSQKYMADLLGYSRATVNRAIRILERHGLIAIHKRSRYHCLYRLLPVRCKDKETEVSAGRNRGVPPRDSNNIQLKRLSNKTVSVNQSDNGSPGPPDGFVPESREEILALDIASGLGDRTNLARYLFLAHCYPEGPLRQILSEARQVPQSRIMKSRGALFSHLLKEYDRQTNHRPGDQPRN